MIKTIAIDILIVLGIMYLMQIGFIEFHIEKIRIIEQIVNLIR